MTTHIDKHTSAHRWAFARLGGSDQPLLRNAADLARLGELDQKLWVALGCPTRGLAMDTHTLDLLDADRDGQIRAPEIIAAAAWVHSLLKNPDSLFPSLTSLPLDAINTSNPQGAKIRDAAARILETSGKSDAKAITTADTANMVKAFCQNPLNGDGVVVPDSAGDPALSQLIQEVVGAVGGVTDRSGAPGVSSAKLGEFKQCLADHSAWIALGEADKPGVFPLGAQTGAALALALELKPKIDDYFARCRLAAFDPRAAALMNKTEADLASLASRQLSERAAEAADFPLARVEADRPLPLASGVNPAWAAQLAQFQANVASPLLGGPISNLAESDWAAIQQRLKPHQAWLAAKKGPAAERLGVARIRTILAENRFASLQTVIDLDLARAGEFASLSDVDRLVYLCRDLVPLLNNFVSFHHFYSLKEKAIFQFGTLYIDGRSCDLCLKVDDAGKHSAMAGLGKICLLYCDCARRSSGERITICAAMTTGDSHRLMVGRNGVFYDRQGRDWDATVVKLVENPISLRQAVWAPYRRIAKLVGDQIEKFASSRDKQVESRMSTSVAATATDVEKGKNPAAAGGVNVASMVGVLAGIGLALGAIGGAFASLTQSFFGLAWWQMPLAVLGAMALVSGPSVLLAWLKLRQRNLAPMLDANGWAVNGRAMINIPFGARLTSRGLLPPHSTLSLNDPFHDEGLVSPNIKLAAWIAIGFGAWYLLFIQGLPNWFR